VSRAVPLGGANPYTGTACVGVRSCSGMLRVGALIPGSSLHAADPRISLYARESSVEAQGLRICGQPT